MSNNVDNNDEEQPTTSEQSVESDRDPVETDGSGHPPPDVAEEESSGLRRRTVIAATLGSPAMFGLGFAGADYLGLSGSSGLEEEGSASLSERAMAGVPILAQMDATTAEVDEEPAQDVPMNRYRTLHASPEVLDTLERDPGDQVRVTRGEDTAVFTLVEMEEIDEEDENGVMDEEEDDENGVMDDEEDENGVLDDEEDDDNGVLDDEEDDDNGVMDDDEEDENGVLDDEEEEDDENGLLDDEEEEDDENGVMDDDDENGVLDDDEEDENDVMDEEEDDEVEEAEADAIVRATREGKCRIAFYDNDEFEDFRRWGPLRGDDNCDLADEGFEVEINPRVPVEDDENGVMEEDDENGMMDDEEDENGVLDDEEEEDEENGVLDDEEDEENGVMDDDEEDENGVLDDDEEDEENDVLDDDEEEDEVDATADEEEAMDEGDLVETYVEGETQVAVLGPHGGQIQPFTDEQVLEVHGQVDGASAWMLQGYGQNTGYHRWYVPSAELSPVSYPQLAELMDEEYDHAVSFHGVNDDTIYVGGTAEEGLRQDIVDEIEEALPHDGSPVALGTEPYTADSDQILVNRVAADGGVWIGQPISDRRESWDVIAEAVATVLGDEVDTAVDEEDDENGIDDDDDENGVLDDDDEEDDDLLDDDDDENNDGL